MCGGTWSTASCLIGCGLPSPSITMPCDVMVTRRLSMRSSIFFLSGMADPSLVGLCDLVHYGAVEAERVAQRRRHPVAGNGQLEPACQADCAARRHERARV